MTESPLIKEKQKLLESLEKSQRGHYRSSETNERRHVVLGLVTVIASTASSSLLFWGRSPTASLIETLLPIISIVAAICASIQTFARYQERSESHRVAAAKYGNLVRELRVAADDHAVRKVFDEWRNVAEASPTTPARHRKEISKDAQ